jgi:hypothetical protein
MRLILPGARLGGDTTSALWIGDRPMSSTPTRKRGEAEHRGVDGRSSDRPIGKRRLGCSFNRGVSAAPRVAVPNCLAGSARSSRRLETCHQPNDHRSSNHKGERDLL